MLHDGDKVDFKIEVSVELFKYKPQITHNIAKTEVNSSMDFKINPFLCLIKGGPYS